MAPSGPPSPLPPPSPPPPPPPPPLGGSTHSSLVFRCTSKPQCRMVGAPCASPPTAVRFAGPRYYDFCGLLVAASLSRDAPLGVYLAALFRSSALPFPFATPPHSSLLPLPRLPSPVPFSGRSRFLGSNRTANPFALPREAPTDSLGAPPSPPIWHLRSSTFAAAVSFIGCQAAFSPRRSAISDTATPAPRIRSTTPSK